MTRITDPADIELYTRFFTAALTGLCANPSIVAHNTKSDELVFRAERVANRAYNNFTSGRADLAND